MNIIKNHRILAKYRNQDADRGFYQASATGMYSQRPDKNPETWIGSTLLRHAVNPSMGARQPHPCG